MLKHSTCVLLNDSYNSTYLRVYPFAKRNDKRKGLERKEKECLQISAHMNMITQKHKLSNHTPQP